MTKDDIIRMAREVYGETDFHESALFHLTQFAALVAAAEREACAKLCDEELFACCWDDDAQAVAEHLAEAIRARGQA